MTEYIEREALINSFRSCGASKDLIDSIVYRINLQKAADVAPVRPGRWIDKGEYAVCMECGGRSGTQYDGVEPIPLMTQFCPNCGAKMDEEVSE